MAKQPRLRYDAVHWFINELTSRIIVQTGNVNDRFHLGQLILQSFKDAPDFCLQIDGATNESNTNEEVLYKSVKCATALRNFGLQTGDTIIIMAPNHLDICIPVYAALYLGVIFAPVDRSLGVNELEDSFSVIQPKIIFCQSEKAPDVQIVLNTLEMDAKIVTFDSGDYLYSLSDFLEEHDDDSPVEEFGASVIDPEDTIACLVPTSGTTGLPKAAAVTHKNFAITGPYWWEVHRTFPTPTRLAMVNSSLQWLTALFIFIMTPILRITRLQYSKPVDPIDLINTYRPTFMIVSPTMMTMLMKSGDRGRCDFTCFENILLGGSAVSKELIEEIKAITPDTVVLNGYGMSELSSICFLSETASLGSCGSLLGCFEHRLVNPDTQEEVVQPFENGELWLKGPGIFKGYYNNVEATEETFAEDHWFKTGDMFYRDENWNFFFVERIKMLMKYLSNQISPVELENVIRQHPGVLDVAVTSIPDPDVGDLVVACVVRQPESDVTAQEIKDLVKDTMSDSKQLRGGVVFLDAMPTTASTKVHRRKLKEMVLTMERE